jgi:undecaprenyl diphosphate synthase
MHLGIIMDGNRRYAKANLLEIFQGHKKGVDSLANVINLCPKYNIDTLTVYAFSTENNYKREEVEVNNLFRIMVESIRKYKRNLIGKNVRVRILGKLQKLPVSLQESLDDITESTKQGSKLLLQICLNYGGRSEIIEAVNQAIKEGEKVITEEIISNKLYSNLEPDIIIRPGGEYRLSNFLTWQSVYSELYFTETLWPNFNENDLIKALNFYHSRARRFGS